MVHRPGAATGSTASARSQSWQSTRPSWASADRSCVAIAMARRQGGRTIKAIAGLAVGAPGSRLHAKACAPPSQPLALASGPSRRPTKATVGLRTVPFRPGVLATPQLVGSRGRGRVPRAGWCPSVSQLDHCDTLEHGHRRTLDLPRFGEMRLDQRSSFTVPRGCRVAARFGAVEPSQGEDLSF